jgi:hypothetical protein
MLGSALLQREPRDIPIVHGPDVTSIRLYPVMFPIHFRHVSIDELPSSTTHTPLRFATIWLIHSREQSNVRRNQLFGWLLYTCNDMDYKKVTLPYPCILPLLSPMNGILHRNRRCKIEDEGTPQKLSIGSCQMAPSRDTSDIQPQNL